MKKNIKRISKIISMSLISANLILVHPSVVNAAEKQLLFRNQKKHFFISTDGAVCGVVIDGSLCEKYSQNGLEAIYYWRSAFVKMSMVGNASATMNLTKPRHVNSSGKLIKQFSDWKHMDYITNAGATVVFSKSSDTDVTYSVNNSNSLRVSYTVGDSSFVGLPVQSGMFSMSLYVYK